MEFAVLILHFGDSCILPGFTRFPVGEIFNQRLILFV